MLSDLSVVYKRTALMILPRENELEALGVTNSIEIIQTLLMDGQNPNTSQCKHIKKALMHVETASDRSQIRHALSDITASALRSKDRNLWLHAVGAFGGIKNSNRLDTKSFAKAIGVFGLDTLSKM
jgi:hypothetical protein